MAKAIYERIRNVKNSLENAEQSFRENNGMRGELDLMLAEAEIKHLREKRGWISICNRQGLALAIAVVVTLAGYGGWLYAGADKKVQAEAIPLQTVATVTAVPKESPQPEEVKPKAEPNLSNKVIEKEQPDLRPVYQKEPVTEQRNAVLPAADMRQLVREARRTLRNAE